MNFEIRYFFCLCCYCGLLPFALSKNDTYFVNEPHCKILEIDPATSPVLAHFHKLKPASCTNLGPLTKIVYKNDRTEAYLTLYPHRFLNYSVNGKIQCSYQYINVTITRHMTSSKEHRFKKTVLLDPFHRCVFVSCLDRSTGQVVYENAHLIILRNERVNLKLNRSGGETILEDSPKLGLNMILFDSISYSSLHRSMPLVGKYLEGAADWFVLKGHHKVAVNTYPNLNAIFTGRFAETFDDERMVWKDFERNHYVTGYFADMIAETFRRYPGRADYESYPMKQVMEHKLSPEWWTYYKICNGNYSVFDQIMDQMIDFSVAFQGERYFSLIANTAYTHDDTSGPSMLELPLLKYLKKMDRLNIRNASIVVLFGDHGLRYGPQRMNLEGGREDSMPMMFISLPKWFQQKNPDIVRALKRNENRVTSQYDLHLTLKHIIQLNGGTPLYDSLKSCPKCQSLLREVPANRSCSDAGIPINYCYCNVYRMITYKPTKRQLRAAQVLVDYMNGQSREFGMGKCVPLRNPVVQYGWTVEGVTVIAFKVNIEDHVFEGAVTEANNSVSILANPLRLNNYGPNELPCVLFESRIRDYCYCNDTHAARHKERHSHGLGSGTGRRELKSLVLIISYVILATNCMGIFNN